MFFSTPARYFSIIDWRSFSVTLSDLSSKGVVDVKTEAAASGTFSIYGFFSGDGAFGGGGCV